MPSDFREFGDHIIQVSVRLEVLLQFPQSQNLISHSDPKTKPSSNLIVFPD